MKELARRRCSFLQGKPEKRAGMGPLCLPVPGGHQSLSAERSHHVCTWHFVCGCACVCMAVQYSLGLGLSWAAEPQEHGVALALWRALKYWALARSRMRAQQIKAGTQLREICQRCGCWWGGTG